MIDISRDLPPLGHIGYVVENVDANADMFRRTLGIEGFRVYDFVPLRAWTCGRELSPCQLRIAIGSLKNDVKIELIQPVAGATPHAQFLNDKGPGLHHAAFYTKQYEEWLDYFKRLGAEIIFEAEAEDEIIGYRRCCYAQVTGMVGIVEITEIARKRT